MKAGTSIIVCTQRLGSSASRRVLYYVAEDDAQQAEAILRARGLITDDETATVVGAVPESVLKFLSLGPGQHLAWVQLQ